MKGPATVEADDPAKTPFEFRVMPVGSPVADHVYSGVPPLAAIDAT
jgi:hypothetical protein